MLVFHLHIRILWEHFSQFLTINSISSWISLMFFTKLICSSPSWYILPYLSFAEHFYYNWMMHFIKWFFWINVFIWFLFFILLIWYILLIHFEMLNHSSRINPLSRINPTTCLWYIVLFIYCWVQLVNIC